MNPNWDPETMPDWNKTTECEPWDEDYVPCRFPYTGLTGYGGAGEKHCYDTFAEISPGSSFVLAESLGIILSVTLIFIGSYRNIYFLIDSERIIIPKKMMDYYGLFNDLDVHKRQSMALNEYDSCNIMSTVLAIVQLIRATDVNAWHGRLNPSLFHILGTIGNCVALTQGLVVMLVWVKLVFIWSDPIKNQGEEMPGLAWYRDALLFMIWVLAFPASMIGYCMTDVCKFDKGCISGAWSCTGRSLFSLCCLAMMIMSMHYIRLIIKSLRRSDRRINFSHEIYTDSISLDSPSAPLLNEDDKSEELIWRQIIKLLKIVVFFVVVCGYIIVLNFLYCIHWAGKIEYFSPGCSYFDVFTKQPAYWILFLWLLGLTMIIPGRQKQIDLETRRAIVSRILTNI